VSGELREASQFVACIIPGRPELPLSEFA